MISLGSLEKRLAGEEKAEFIRFMMSMLKWLPEERKTAKQLLEDPWYSDVSPKHASFVTLAIDSCLALPAFSRHR